MGAEERPQQSGKKRVVGFQVLEDECIWMKAGVVNFRLCDNAYDCFNCSFDRGMRKAMGLPDTPQAGSVEPAWVEYLRKRYDGSSRPCRHALTGRINAPKLCTLDYECHHCPFDQMLDEQDLGRPSEVPVCRNIAGFRVAQGYYYHMGHSWARFEHGGRVRVGFDDFLVRLFGAIQELELPPLGAMLRQDQVGWLFGRGNHQAAVLAPVSGRVLALNHGAGEHPEITHNDPYQEGWLFILEPEEPKRNLKRLYYDSESYPWIEQESAELLRMLGPEYERLAATGGRTISDIYGRFPELGWERLARTFLKTEAV